jgi:tetratricopeptide (TPR) repeat protein
VSLSQKDQKNLHKAKLLWDAAKVDEAWELVQDILTRHPYDYIALQMGGHIYEKAGNMPVAYHFFRTATEQNPKDGTAWMNYGRTAEELWRTPEAERAYAKALKYADRDETTRCTLGNLSALCIDNARYQEAIDWANKCLEQWPDDKQTLANVGFAKLGLGQWSDGWKMYRNILGTDMRTRINYHGEPEWDGSPDKTVVLYGEQGIGDEVSFASMVPDALKVCKKVILDCDLRLANLFARSFPQARVYGTRKSRPHGEKVAKWHPDDREFDASLAIGQIGEYFRTDVSMCPGRPYLVSCPDRTLMWKALWKQKQKPVIGIAWNGGIPRTGSHLRRWTLEDLLPVFRAVDAHWVCLEYKPAGADLDAFRAKHPEIDIKEYPHATLTKDYDDTAALVASLDMVFCIQTAVAHLGGALGVPTWVCVPPCSQWRYGTEGETIPWYDSVRVIRQQKGQWNFSQIAEELSANFRAVPRAASKAA